ncbi:ABC transporter ATP-binding protein [Mechercharimyces sp. CAU 1602]|uniref:ABC transporter ATP-binding protein n=1 Tax=Mechercharimyces sp. CAU 1602 TaxID=2973933 RepID=UPI0021623BFC|nr:ABC transporter ATP-binding protein [Mechercharimyces sp. CAU 1602]MCS1350534.1 ABC transporter ATP-binding protein [Mechercharimyces sp. CAU 1602]
MIQVTKLSKRYGDEVALHPLDLHFTSARIYGVIGPDGAGKSTLLRCMSGALLPSSGQVEVNRHSLGYVSSRFGLYEEMSIAENLRFYGGLYGLDKEQIKERSTELLRWIGLSSFQNRLTGALSGGMKQKLAIAVALLHAPKVLILDEPTYGVDPLSRREVWKLLKEIRKHGTTVIVSTQYLEESSYCDEVLFLYKGKLLLQEDPAVLLEQFPFLLYEMKVSTRPTVKQLHEARQLRFVVDVYWRGESLMLVCEEESCKKEVMDRFGWGGNQVVQTVPSFEDVVLEQLRKIPENGGTSA